MKLKHLLDRDLLVKHMEEGFVSRQEHPFLPLAIYNYTHKAQYEPRWGDGTIDQCRTDCGYYERWKCHQPAIQEVPQPQHPVDA